MERNEKDGYIFLLTLSEEYAIEERRAISSMLFLLDAVNEMRKKPENRPLYCLNVLDITPTKEPHTSEIIKSILEYKGKDSYPVFESFAERFLSSIGFDSTLIRHPKFYAEKEHVDIIVRDDDYIVIIENKLRNAPFQRNQIARYIAFALQSYRKEQIYIVLLPQYPTPDYLDRMRPSVWNLPDDYEEPNSKRHCRDKDEYQCRCDSGEMSDRCGKCLKFKDDFSKRTIVINDDFATWLGELLSIIPERESVFRAGILQFTDYIKGLYQIRISDSLKMDIVNFLSDRIFSSNDSAADKWKILNDKIEDIAALKSAMESMRLPLSKDLIDEWYNELKDRWPMLKREPHKSFGININGIWVGCWCGSMTGGFPWWGFQCDNKGKQEQQQLAKSIIEECGITVYKSSQNYIYWNTTQNGAERCNAFYEAAQRRGLI